jgi:hypothetical protein
MMIKARNYRHIARELIHFKMFCGDGPFITSVPDIDMEIRALQENQYREKLLIRFKHCCRILGRTEMQIRQNISTMSLTPFQTQIFYVAQRILREADSLGLDVRGPCGPSVGSPP